MEKFPQDLKQIFECLHTDTQYFEYLKEDREKVEQIKAKTRFLFLENLVNPKKIDLPKQSVKNFLSSYDRIINQYFEKK